MGHRFALGAVGALPLASGALAGTPGGRFQRPLGPALRSAPTAKKSAWASPRRACKQGLEREVPGPPGLRGSEAQATRPWHCVLGETQGEGRPDCGAGGTNPPLGQERLSPVAQGLGGRRCWGSFCRQCSPDEYGGSGGDRVQRRDAVGWE